MDILEKLIAQFRNSLNVSLQPTTIDDETVVLIPDGYKVEQLDRFSDKIRRAQERISVYRVNSFLDYWGRFQTDNSICFGDLENLRLHAVVDYHGKKDAPAHCDHNFSFHPKRDLAWEFWSKKIQGQYMSQRDFQRVLEERTRDIVEPIGAVLLELVANLEATMRIEAGDVHRLDNGSRKIQYTKENEVRGNVTIPPELLIESSIFEAGEPIKYQALLRWDIDENTHKAKFMLEIPDINGIEQQAFAALASDVEKKVGDRFFWASK